MHFIIQHENNLDWLQLSIILPGRNTTYLVEINSMKELMQYDTKMWGKSSRNPIRYLDAEFVYVVFTGYFVRVILVAGRWASSQSQIDL